MLKEEEERLIKGSEREDESQEEGRREGREGGVDRYPTRRRQEGVTVNQTGRGQLTYQIVARQRSNTTGGDYNLSHLD